MTTDQPVVVRRDDDDDEILGYLRPVADRWQPTTVFHAVLAEPSERDAAEDVLRRDGMTSLSDPWWLEGTPGDWREVRIQEARPDRVRVRWADPMAEQPAHGHWVDPLATPLHRVRPR
ncbi:hypothetical protein V5P93_000184 [Actinokineospora auranticolor]|uniref:Uncharacterized protein n=1 Tax=Actinokineospora auranticolor TaxID=155976 RepID=A0A2S6GL66_9PSEU|nr:hypothetical protein [Actinokineospora auranticolor]PPK65923.1 hypothetical protein CLV40_112190 [Actinokineospora auranticolor]